VREALSRQHDRPQSDVHVVRQHHKHCPPVMGTMWSHRGLSCYTTAPADSVPRACSLSSGTIARGPSNSRPSTAPLAVQFLCDTPNSHWWIRWCGTSRRMAAQVNDFSRGQRPRCEWPGTLEVLGVSPRWQGSCLESSGTRSTTWWLAIGTRWFAAASNVWFRVRTNERGFSRDCGPPDRRGCAGDGRVSCPTRAGSLEGPQLMRIS
jgi:hypothetical protein